MENPHCSCTGTAASAWRGRGERCAEEHVPERYLGSFTPRRLRPWMGLFFNLSSYIYLPSSRGKLEKGPKMRVSQWQVDGSIKIMRNFSKRRCVFYRWACNLRYWKFFALSNLRFVKKTRQNTRNTGGVLYAAIKKVHASCTLCNIWSYRKIFNKIYLLAILPWNKTEHLGDVVIIIMSGQNKNSPKASNKYIDLRFSC